jgi:hypothetical protein
MAHMHVHFPFKIVFGIDRKELQSSHQLRSYMNKIIHNFSASMTCNRLSPTNILVMKNVLTSIDCQV